MIITLFFREEARDDNIYSPRIGAFEILFGYLFVLVETYIIKKTYKNLMTVS